MRRRRKNHQKLERWIEQPVVLSSRSRANFSELESSSVGGDTTTMRPSPSGRAFLRRGRRQVAPRVLVETCHAYGIFRFACHREAPIKSRGRLIAVTSLVLGGPAVGYLSPTVPGGSRTSLRCQDPMWSQGFVANGRGVLG